MNAWGNAVVVAGALCAAAMAARAQDMPQEFLGWQRGAPASTARTVVEPTQWQRLARGATSFGPVPLRADDVALLEAARAGRWSEVLELLKPGRADANARDPYGEHALARAARAGRDDVVRLLLRHGAETDRVGADGFTPLGGAAFAGHRSTVRILLRAGAAADAYGSTGQGPLHLASMNDHVGVIDELLVGGLDPWARNRAGDTALDVAAQRGSQRAMDRLIAAGVDPARLGR